MIARNVEQAQYSGRLVQSDPFMELMAPIRLDSVCFRFNPGELDDKALEGLNKEILVQLQEQGCSTVIYHPKRHLNATS
jgi:glutamate/tyrosine decarboxylase-like PLP-dependent enzyme